MNKENNLPVIRFAGFTDAWEQREFGELAENTYGGGTPNTSNTEFWMCVRYFLHILKILDQRLAPFSS